LNATGEHAELVTFRVIKNDPVLVIVLTDVCVLRPQRQHSVNLVLLRSIFRPKVKMQPVLDALFLRHLRETDNHFVWPASAPPNGHQTNGFLSNFKTQNFTPELGNEHWILAINGNLTDDYGHG